MPKSYANIATMGSLRLFAQGGGGSVQNALSLAGVQMGYAMMTGVSRPRLGGVTPINRFDPSVAGRYVVAGRSISAPALPKWQLTLDEAKNGIPLPDTIGPCPYNFYEVKGICNNLSDHLRGWKGGNVRVYADGLLTDDNLGDRTSDEKDDPLKQELTFEGRDIYVYGTLGVGQASISILSDKSVKDIVYGTALTCANCGSPNDGTKFIYACTAAGTTSPGTKPYVVYSTNYGATWTASQVTTAAVAEDLVAIDIIGQYLVVFSKTGGGSNTSALYYATIGATGAPGSWTKVTTGFVGAAPVNDIFVLNDNKAFLAADGGYIYTMTGNPGTGVTVVSSGGVTTQNLLRISGTNEIILLSGASSTLLYSINQGINFSASPSTPVAAVSFGALFAVDSQKWWVGTSTGRVFGSVDAGNSWNEITVQTSGGVINDIVFATPEVGYFLDDISSAGNIYRTYTGGFSWDNGDPNIVGLGTFTSLARVAVPSVGSTATVIANNAAFGGQVTAGVGAVLTGSGVVF